MTRREHWGPPPWSWPGITALVLAAALGVGWCATLVIASLPSTPQISEKGLELLNGIGQVLAGAVATFIGSQIASQRDDRQDGRQGAVDAGTPVPAVTPLPGPVSAAQGAVGEAYSATRP